MKKKRTKSKLVPYVKKTFISYIGNFDLKFQLDSDPNVKCLSMNKMANGHTLFWISGFGEREVFYLTYVENSKKRPYFCLVEDIDEIVFEKKEN